MKDWQLNFLKFPLVCGLECANCEVQKDIKEGIELQCGEEINFYGKAEKQLVFEVP